MGKNVDNLDDVAQLLSRKSEQKIILKKRNQSQRILRNKRKKREVNDYADSYPYCGTDFNH